ncbi:uncharacterized protein VDAG_00867 [Verticillium dahliae VdLs.17]|uniref:Conserved oligomeric Golgi complex subunit 3 n=1 Tax=Verticillium dahliae (strain VdLs.17 / ATCC MYA-4575 / FGSC 10137) TaxID=498257 RepID=G2WSU4_VERDV|nr:uncharacterized protein VDAG_00867 [Verticillium dahliae VdLs.17]EGY17185.1 hypothetical protein VDAG_00867 [Verticillium dahliae VdLs.17]
MYDDSWYSFVPEVAKTAASTVKNAGHRRKESLLQQPNSSQGTIQPSEAPEPLSLLLEDPQDNNDPPEPALARRAKSYSDFYHVVRAQLAKDAHKKREDRKRRKDKSLEALMIAANVDNWLAANVDNMPVPRRPVLDQYNDQLLEASQHEYLSPADHVESIYKDQLELTERHLDALIVDTNASLDLLTTLSNSFQAVETQTTSFQSQCEDLIDEQKRLQKLADEVGTDLYFYTYLDNVTRRLNAPGAGRLVEDAVFGEVLDNLNSCIDFMTKHPTYRDADSYLARYESQLTKALHLLEVGLSNRLKNISDEIAKPIAASKSEATRHALAYGRFAEMIADTYSLLPNIHKVMRNVFDEYGQPLSGTAHDIYVNTANNLFSTYLAVRNDDLKPMTDKDVAEFARERKDLSVETGCRNYLKQTFERAYNENSLVHRIFGLDLQWSSDPASAYQALKSASKGAVNPANIAILSANLCAALKTEELRTVCNIVAWLMNEYLVLDYDEEESPFSQQCRELSARILTEHLWVFTDDMFNAETTKTITKMALDDEGLKIKPVVDGVSASNAYAAVTKAMGLLAMYDQTMPKERSQKNNRVVFNIVRESVKVLQRAEARIKYIKNGTDADLFMIKNLLIIKNELLSLEIGDIRGDGAALQHFGQIWNTLSPQNWVSFFGSIIGGVGSVGSSFWSSSAKAAPPAVTAGSLTVEDMNEQLDELLRQSIVAFTQRWGGLTMDAKARKAGVKPIGKVEKELEEVLQTAFSNQPEVIGKLKEAIAMHAEAQEQAAGEKKGVRRY